jgi:ribosomal protein S18 acetylase RimI-like enzyme
VRDEILLRECEVADIEAVLELWRRAGAVQRPTDRADALRRRIAHDDGLFLLAAEGARVVGPLIGAWDGWRGGLYRLAVDPDVRRRGIASRLVEEVERRMCALGAERVAIRVFHGEPGAVEFWRALGYRPEPDESIYAKGLS